MQNKLLFAGPVGAGKTTAITTISTTKPVGTEVPLQQAIGDKTSTTVALDYSFVHLDGELLNLYGLPGQDSLAFMRDILVPGALGVLLLLDASAANIEQQAIAWLGSMKKTDANLRFVIGITKTDVASDFSLNRLRSAVEKTHPGIPMLSVDARQRDHVKALIELLLASS
jgi:hypothetical protein